MDESYVEKILKARVYDVAIESPLEAAPRLSRRLANDVWFKREDCSRSSRSSCAGPTTRLPAWTTTSRAVA